MQVDVAKCYKRGCKHWDGFKKVAPDVIANVCDAFPNGIPDQIAFGQNKHLKPLEGQPNDIVFEKEETT